MTGAGRAYRFTCAPASACTARPQSLPFSSRTCRTSSFSPETAETLRQNRLIISIQPEMSIRLQVQAKRPGVDMMLNTVDMVFDYQGTYVARGP
ncbi:MAG: hypothetical protein WKG07_21735 [Hymenobacter sp.]